MPIFKNQSHNTSKEFLEEGESNSNKIPMDLNYSPIEDYLNQLTMVDDNNNAINAAASPTPLSNVNSRTMPILIPSSSAKRYSEEKEHQKRRVKPVAKTVPDNGLEAVIERKFKQSNEYMSVAQNNKTEKNSQTFFVGSLKEKPPVPWPTTLTSTPDKNHRRLTNRRTVNWPLVPENSRQYPTTTSDEGDNIFTMEDG